MTIEETNKQYLLNGMPCHTYILKKLRNERDILVFEKAFIETLLSFGFEHDSIETALCLCSQKVLPNSPIYGKEFHLLGEHLYIGNFIDSLWLDHTIPKYDTCHAYYKTFDNHCTACQICVYSPYYRNKQQAGELELLRYAFQSPQNLNQLKNMGLNAVCFRSVYNITQSLITAEQPKLFQLHKILYKLLNKSIDRYYRSESAGCSFDYKLQAKLIDELSALNLPSSYCTEEWYKKQILIFEELIFSKRPKTKEEIEFYLKSVLKKEKYIPPKINKLKSAQNNSVSPPTDIFVDSFIHIEETTDRISNDNSEDSLHKTMDNTPCHLNEKSEILVNDTSDYTDICITDCSTEKHCTDTGNKEHTTYDSSMSKFKQTNNLIYIPTIKETELSSCAVSLKTKNTLILSKFESAVLSGKRMVTEVIKSDNGTTYLLILVPRIHVFFYSDLTEPASNSILLPLFSKKQILKITYSPYWIYSLIYQYTKKRTYSIESIQFMHCLAEYTTLDYVSVFRSHGIMPTFVEAEYQSTRPATSAVFQMMPAYSTCYRKLKRCLYQKELDKTYILHKQLAEAISISYDMTFWFSEPSFLFTMPVPFSYKFNPVDLRRLQTNGYLLIYQIESLNELPYPFFQEVLSRLVQKGRLWCIEMQIISYSENQLVLFLSESCFSYALEIMSRTLFDCVSEKEEYGILIDYKYVHITKQSSLKQQKSSDTEILKSLSDKSVIIYPNDEEKEAIPFS